jgi:hypothetical protein
VIKDPPNIFEEQLAKLVSSVEEVKAEREVLDSRRLHVVSRDLAELRRTIGEHESRLTEVQIQLRGKSTSQFKCNNLTRSVFFDI